MVIAVEINDKWTSKEKKTLDIKDAIVILYYQDSIYLVNHSHKIESM